MLLFGEQIFDLYSQSKLGNRIWWESEKELLITVLCTSKLLAS